VKANYAVSPPHSAFTARAYSGTRRAVGRAGYRERWTDPVGEHVAMRRRWLYVVLLCVAGLAAGCNGCKVTELQRYAMSGSGEYIVLTTRVCGTAASFVVVGQRPGASEDVFNAYVPYDTTIQSLVERHAVSVVIHGDDQVVVRYENWMRPHLMNAAWQGHPVSYEPFADGQRSARGWPSNNPIKLSVRPVTHLAAASCAPARPAAYRVR